jgi:hypothetical protein
MLTAVLGNVNHARPAQDVHARRRFLQYRKPNPSRRHLRIRPKDAGISRCLLGDSIRSVLYRSVKRILRPS